VLRMPSLIIKRTREDRHQPPFLMTDPEGCRGGTRPRWWHGGARWIGRWIARLFGEAAKNRNVGAFGNFDDEGIGGTVFEMILREQSAQSPSLDTHRRAGTRLEIGRLAENAGGDRVFLECCRTSMEGLLDQKSKKTLHPRGALKNGASNDPVELIPDQLGVAGVLPWGEAGVCGISRRCTIDFPALCHPIMLFDAGTGVEPHTPHDTAITTRRGNLSDIFALQTEHGADCDQSIRDITRELERSMSQNRYLVFNIRSLLDRLAWSA
jgi:hypothetical protein